ncbi:hypothetical protein DUI87_22263 [Hirundo rustica rustica]|uniref:Uncharacterized protein n=1 Tax=Hirundo rustica rustica TaxID=333673 RepID=A0A3M0JJ73_HIRRU|nr:hypothetical protein DUI87_22263 [Hirundo rustica rustica]
MAPSATSSLSLNTSRDGHSTTSSGTPFQYFITLLVKNFFLIPTCISLDTARDKFLSFHQYCLEKDNNSQLAKTTLQEVVESDKVSESPLLQAKQPQFPQSFLTGFVFQAPHQPRCPPLDVLKDLNVPPKLRGPELDTALEVWPHQCRVQGKNDLPGPAGHPIPDPGQDAIGPLGHLGTLLAHVQPAIDQYPQFSLPAAAFSNAITSNCLSPPRKKILYVY